MESHSCCSSRDWVSGHTWVLAHARNSIMDAEEGGGMSTTVKVVAFKKRVIKGQLRGSGGAAEPLLDESKRTYYGRDDDEDGGEGVDNKTLEDVKFEQQMRRRQLGVDAKSLLKKPVKASSTAAAASSSSSSAAVASGVLPSVSQTFSAAGTNMDLDIGSNPHESIMETYVAEQLGLNKAEGGPSAAPLTADEKLYRVPEEIRALEGRQADDVAALSSEAEAGIYAGMAEVALPASFRLKNLQETEKAMRELEARGKLPHQSSQHGGGNFRFHQRPAVGTNGGGGGGGGGSGGHTTVPGVGAPAVDAGQAGQKRPNSTQGQGQSSAHGPFRKPAPGQSHDNYVMMQFKKRNMR